MRITAQFTLSNVLPLFESETQQSLTERVSVALRDGAAVITANARSARFLRLAYAEEQRAHGREMWASPQIFDWDSWLASLWEKLALLDPDVPLLLTPLQEHFLWKRVQQGDARLVVSPDGMASLAQGAYALLSAYRLHHSRKTPWGGPDAEQFRQWASAFDRQCQDNHWISRSEIEDKLCEAVKKGGFPVPANILLVGFDRVTPLQERLLKVLRGIGTMVEDADIPQQEKQENTLIAADDLRDEITACAQWCRLQIEKNPAAHIGVIAPDIRDLRTEMERIFQFILMPQSLDITAAPAVMPFEFSLGIPLATVPAIRAALLLLRWTMAPLSQEAVTWLLISGFLSDHPSEASRLALFDFNLRDRGSLSPEIYLDTFVHSAKSHDFKDKAMRVSRMMARSGAAKDRKPYIEWCEFAELLLETGGWPGYLKPDSVQFQAQKRWQRLLDELALLDFAGRPVSFDDFLKTLERQAAETIFTPESHHAPVQITGAFESSGQTFDAVWFLNADDMHWPLAGSPHPMLPLSLQRNARMPHSSTAVDTDIALITTKRIFSSAPKVVFSYARQNKEGELRHSPLLEAVFGQSHPIISSHEFRAKLGIIEPPRNKIALDTLIRNSEVVQWPRERVAGGASILKEQGACPFQAFATRRLAARPLNRAEWGLSAMERGSLMHKILESIWSPDAPDEFRMVSFDDLKQTLADNRLDEVLSFHIHGAMQSLLESHANDSWMNAYLESEQQRLLVRLREWMACEAQRQPFAVQAREERLKDVRVGELKLDLRADRIDELPNGSHLLIDYKTGSVSTADWQGERPNEPQLPLYAVYGNVENVSGLLFAQIRAGETEFIGRVAHAKEQFHTGLTANSPLINEPYDGSMREGWQRALLALAEEFLRGEASVDPKDGAETCKFCPLPGLCRVAEAEVAADGEEADNG